MPLIHRISNAMALRVEMAGGRRQLAKRKQLRLRQCGLER